MKRLIYQVCLGKQSNSKLYKKCIESVALYCKKHDIEHYVQRVGKLKIKPDVFATNRSEDSYMKHGGFLPIYEKENAFDLLDEYDQIAIIDADIFIRESAPNIFESFGTEYAFGAVVEREMPITDKYKDKIYRYSEMQYGLLHSHSTDFKPNALGFEFFNMGLILLNSQLFKPYLKEQNAKQFISRSEFKGFIDGQGAWKWSTDQTLLNYFLKKENVPVKHMSWVWNGLYGANTKIQDCHFVHFFLKDLLPEGGENVDELLRMI
jgi:lipopolysaccharide biosynthesis glycosyltransferase